MAQPTFALAQPLGSTSHRQVYWTEYRGSMDAIDIINDCRAKLVETTASFWTDAELLRLVNAGIADLWRAISDNFQDYFFTVNESVTHVAGSRTLTGVPSGVAKVLTIEPVTRSSYPSLNYFPRPYNSPEMSNARARDAIDPGQAGPCYYAITGAGAPIAAPTIYVEPRVSVTVPIRLAYTPTTPKLTVAVGQANPVPGESDQALIDYVMAHALAKEREDRKPDPDWLSLYGTEKQNILTFCTPRQNDEPDVAEAIFEQFTDG
jgi:hypothetical protein